MATDLDKLTKEELKDMIKDRKHLTSTIKKKDEEIEKLKQKNQEDVESAEKRAAKKSENEINTLKQQVNQLQEYAKKKHEDLNEIMFQYGALLKSMQGVTDSHIYINEQMAKNFKNKE